VPAGLLLTVADDVQHLLPGRFRVDSGGAECLGRHPVVLPEQAEQQVLGANVAMPQRPGFLLAVHHHLARPGTEPLEQRSLAPAGLAPAG
jgi:hypothetical protein